MTFALEKQTCLQQKQTRFILTLPVAGAVGYGTASGISIPLFLVQLEPSSILLVFHHPHGVLSPATNKFYVYK